MSWVPGSKGGADACDRRLSAFWGLPLACQLQLLPAPPGAASARSAPGCAIVRSSRPGRRVSVQHWVLGGAVFRLAQRGCPGHYPCPLLGIPGPFPEVSWEGKKATTGLDAGCRLGAGAPGISPTRPLRATPLQVSLPQSCCRTSRDQAGGAEAVSRCTLSPSEQV